MNKRAMRTCSVLWMAVLTAGCQGAASMVPSVMEDDEPERSETPRAGGSTSDFGGSTVPCPCGHLQVFSRERPVAVRATVEAQTGNDSFSLRLRDVLGGALSLAPGEIFEATWDGKFPCYAGCSDVSVGDDVFAFYWVDKSPCAARQECIADCISEFVENGAQGLEIRSECSETYVMTIVQTEPDCEGWCERMSTDACPAQPEIDGRRGRVRMTRWTDPLVFALTDLGELSIAVADLDELWPVEGEFTPSEIAACTEHFGDWSDLLEHAP